MTANRRTSNEYVTYAEAARILRVHPTTFRMQISKGVVKTLLVGSKRRISKAEVRKWKKYFNTLNEEFAWLVLTDLKDSARAETYNLRQTARKLDVCLKTVERWTAAGLLPFYPDSFTNGSYMYRVYLASYIDGLVRFGAGCNIIRSVAVEYKERCSRNRRVM